MHELQEKDPNVFGPGGGSSRIFSLTEMSFAAGLMLGPVLCGSLADAFGFYYTALALGEDLLCEWKELSVAVADLFFFPSCDGRFVRSILIHVLHSQITSTRNRGSGLESNSNVRKLRAKPNHNATIVHPLSLRVP